MIWHVNSGRLCCSYVSWWFLCGALKQWLSKSTDRRWYASYPGGPWQWVTQSRSILSPYMFSDIVYVLWFCWSHCSCHSETCFSWLSHLFLYDKNLWALQVCDKSESGKVIPGWKSFEMLHITNTLWNWSSFLRLVLSNCLSTNALG